MKPKYIDEFLLIPKVYTEENEPDSKDYDISDEEKYEGDVEEEDDPQELYKEKNYGLKQPGTENKKNHNNNLVKIRVDNEYNQQTNKDENALSKDYQSDTSPRN